MPFSMSCYKFKFCMRFKRIYCQGIQIIFAFCSCASYSSVLSLFVSPISGWNFFSVFFFVCHLNTRTVSCHSDKCIYDWVGEIECEITHKHTESRNKRKIMRFQIVETILRSSDLTYYHLFPCCWLCILHFFL